ncbi:MAG: CapA family protein [Prevotellaceae bacterium]|jgi:poly-gamma-glutamate synthesis protein (capsule biosynthesis protein)|nr:CapA family protein [Prevotellaceae bacterium]
MKKVKIVILFLLLYGRLWAQDTLTLTFVGDVMMHQTQINSAKTSEGYQLDDCFSYIYPHLSTADITIANLEVTLAGEPYSGYPQFSAPDALVEALQRAGVDVLLTANNHSCDKGKMGVERTLQVLDSLNLLHTGTFYDSLHHRRATPLLLIKNNFEMALLNYTYGTNDIPVPAPTVVNLIDTVQMLADIEQAKTLQPDIIAVALHWGDEYQLYPNKTQRNLADFLARNGVRLIIGSHPHVLQPIEALYAADSTVETVVVYSQGNFISNMTAANTDIGTLVNIRLIKYNDKVIINHVGYTYVWTYKPQVEGQRRFYVLPAAKYENNKEFLKNIANYKRMTNALSAMRALYTKANKGPVEEDK